MIVLQCQQINFWHLEPGLNFPKGVMDYCSLSWVQTLPAQLERLTGLASVGPSDLPVGGNGSGTPLAVDVTLFHHVVSPFQHVPVLQEIPIGNKG